MAEESLGVVAPIVPPVAAPEATPTPDSPADQAVETPEGEEPSKPEKTYTETEHRKAIQQRLGVESRRLEKLARAEAERDLYKRQLEEAQRPREAQPKDGEPQQKDFTDYEEYLLAKAEYRYEQKQAKTREATQRQTSTQQQEREEADRGRAIRQKFASAEEKYPDFKEAIEAEDLPFNGAILAYIEDSKIGGDVAYHLATNRDEAVRIAQLSPIQQVIALRDVESKLTANPAPTRTPAPIVPNGTKTTVDRDPSKMSDKEFNDWRKRQIAQRGRH